MNLHPSKKQFHFITGNRSLEYRFVKCHDNLLTVMLRADVGGLRRAASRCRPLRLLVVDHELLHVTDEDSHALPGVLAEEQVPHGQR